MDTKPFGHYRLPLLARLIVAVCSSIKPVGLLKTLVFFLRKPVLIFVGTAPVDVVTGGVSFRLFPKKNLSDKRLLCSPYQIDGVEREFFAKVLPNNAKVIDIGANVGGFGLLLLAARKDITCVLVEADPDIARRLRENIAFSGFDARVCVMQVAATPEVSEVKLRLDTVNSGKNSVCEERDLDGSDYINVQGLSLAEIMQRTSIECADLIKLDIEGYELPVLRQYLANVERPFWPIYVQIEQHRLHAHNEAVLLMLANGYEIVMQTRMNVILKIKS